jgi:hypothetical protein
MWDTMLSRCLRNDLAAFAVIASVLPGCGGKVTVTDDAQPWHSGSRLRARVLDGGDGAVKFLGWHDSELDVECGFRLAEDGELRCLPGGSYSLVYEDPECSRSAAILAPCEAVPDWVSVELPPAEPVDDCTYIPYGARALRVAGESQSARFHTMESGACGPAQTVGTDVVMVSLEPADATEFVAATEREGSTSEDLAARVFEAEDGSTQVIGFRDTARQHECYADDWFSPVDRCVPAPGGDNVAWIANYYADAGCTDAVAYSTPTCGPQPEYVYGFRYGQCPATSVYAIGEAYQGPAYRYSLSDDSCNPVEVGWRDSHLPFRYGEDIADQFPLVQHTEVGAGRLRVRRASGAGTTLTWGMTFVDHETGEACDQTFLDGALRCGRTNAASYSDYYFKDPNCSEPLIVWNRGSPGCENELPGLALRTTYDECATDSSFYLLGDEWPGDIYVLSDGTCASETRGPRTSYHLPGEMVDPDTFPELTERIE